MPRDRRRRERRDRRPVVNAPAVEAAVRGPTLAGKPVARQREWRWRTFPVFCTFAVTLFVTSLLTSLLLRQPGLNPLEVLGAAATAWALAHLISVRLFENRFPERPREEHRDRGPST